MLRRSLFISLALILFACAVWYVLSSLTAHTRQLNVIVLTVEGLHKDLGAGETAPNLTTTSSGCRFTKQYPLVTFAECSDAVKSYGKLITAALYANPGRHITKQVDDPLYWLALKKRNNEQFFLQYHSSHKLQGDALEKFDDWLNTFLDFLANSGLRSNTIILLAGEQKPGNQQEIDRTRLDSQHKDTVSIPLLVWLPPGKNRSLPDPETTGFNWIHYHDYR